MRKHVIILLLLIGCFTFCRKTDIKTNSCDENPKVEQFILSLKTNEYKSIGLPDFTPEDIPCLLKFGKDLSVISYFPTSSICSYSLFQYRLGECILWTIESIRTKYPYQNIRSQFPSCVPMLIHYNYIEEAQTIQGTDPAKYRITDTELLMIQEKYVEWWNIIEKKGFDELKTVNPIADLKVFWY